MTSYRVVGAPVVQPDGTEVVAGARVAGDVFAPTVLAFLVQAGALVAEASTEAADAPPAPVAPDREES